MRSRRVTASIGLALLCGLIAAPPPAEASGPTSTTVVSRTALPSAFTSYSGVNVCSGTSGAILHVTGPTSPPLGVGSLELEDFDSADITLLDDASSQNIPATDLTRFMVHTDESASDTVELHALIYAGVSVFGLNIPATGSWTTTNVLTATGETGTWSQFLAANPGVTIDQIGVKLEGCNTAGQATADVDDLEIGFSGQTTRYDFEPATAPAGQVVGQVNHRAIAAGGSVIPRATLSASGHPVAGVTLSLLAKTAGKSAYHQIGAATTSGSGAATGPVQHPKASTSYEWTVPNGADVQATTSAATKVAVASKVTLDLGQSAARTRNLQAVGTVTPAHAGAKVTLWVKSGSHRKKLGTAKLRKDGTYQITATLKNGHHKVFATAAADSTNAAGTSPTRKIFIR